MSKQQMKLEVKSPDGELLGDIEFEAPEDFTVIISKNIERSPLHPEAINMDDLKVGMNIKPYHVRHGSGPRDVGLINGEPFRRGTKYHASTQGHVWMVPVVRTNYFDTLIHEDWFLADIGVVPYEYSDGSCHWSDQHYTLAVN